MPASESFKERLKNENKRANKQYFNQRSQANNFAKGSSLIPPIMIPNKIFDKIYCLFKKRIIFVKEITFKTY